MDSITIYFVNKLSTGTHQIPFVILPNQTMVDILPEIAKKFNMHMQNVAIACEGGKTLTIDDYNFPIRYLIEKYGKIFDIIDRSEVGANVDKANGKYIETQVDKLIHEFDKKWWNIGPKHSAWQKRIKLEIQKIIRYIDYLKAKGNEPWFKLVPSKNKKFNFLVWEGNLTVSSRKEITFEIRVILNTDYPKTCPRCFIDEYAVNYSGKLYFKNLWEDKGRKFIMICHDHMAEKNAWSSNLGIVHFFLREIWIWWMAQQNHIIREWDEKHKN